MKRSSLTHFLPLALVPLARAQGTVQDLWNLPDYPDYTTFFTAGDTVNISWQPGLVDQFPYFCGDCDILNVDLWLTASAYTRRLGAGLDVNRTMWFNWTINLDNQDVEESRDWTLRFLPADVQWGDNDQEISSAKFNINPAPEEDEPSSSSTPLPTSTTATVPGTPSATTPGDSGNGDDSDDSLSTGAKAGIGVGAGAGGLIIVALAFLLWRRLRALPAHKAPGADNTAGAYNDLHHPPPPGVETQQPEGYFAGAGMAKPPAAFAGPPAPLSELHGDAATEMDAGADGQRVPAELDAGTQETGAQR
ncbi:hypothetical protein ASPCAL11516 [Aspergillus calidoustus]|uniref:Uncharacterized protein n=1 Tax=Aspergillus calidoustus TaxID=454130 RepID=A0A0U5GBM4_ASPCI|nr:hypothetical protein ASPCAL11516 [Aspergillus calidoustus]